MRDILPDVDAWISRDEKIALATVIQTWGSSPRGAGAHMALTTDGKISGSVSGGCVEGAVFEAGLDSIRSRLPQRLHFGVADETAWQVGLACGGQLDVFVQPLDESFYALLHNKLTSGQAFAVATLIHSPDSLLGKQFLLPISDSQCDDCLSPLEEAIRKRSRRMRLDGRSGILTFPGPDGDPVEVFIEMILPQPTLVIVGGVHIAIALARLASVIGFYTIVIDPRKSFGSKARFPHADRLVQKWPDEAFALLDINENTAIAVLTHDPKIDDPALLVALASPAFYVGALGSLTTQTRRLARLAEAGLSAAQLARLHGPIGLPLNAQIPEEIALAVMAEIVAVRRGAKSEPISDYSSVKLASI